MKKVVLIFLIVLVGAAVVYYSPVLKRESVRTKNKDSGRTPEKTELPVRSALVTRGIVESSDDAEVSTKVIGRIRRILVEENEHVAKGQTLVQLDDEEIKAQMNEVKASILKAKADYEKSVLDHERYERLYKNRAVTLNEVEEYKRRVQISKSELNRVEAKIDVLQSVIKDYVLKAPIKGVVIKKYFQAGEVVNPGSAVLLLADTDVLKVRTELDETDVGKVTVGQSANITADAYPGQLYEGVVEKISQDIKREKIRTFDPMSWIDVNAQEVTIVLKSSSGLKIGMTVEVRFEKGG